MFNYAPDCIIGCNIKRYDMLKYKSMLLFMLRYTFWQVQRSGKEAMQWGKLLSKDLLIVSLTCAPHM